MRAVILIIFNVLLSVRCKRVLGIYGHPGRSHQILGETILKKLAERGHEVTMVSTYPLKNPIPNYKDIYLDGLLEDINSDDKIYLEMEKSIFLSFDGAFEIINHFTDKTFEHHAMQDLIKSGKKYDLIVMDWFVKDAELFYGNIFEAPIIVTCSFGTQQWLNYLVGNPEPYSYVPVSGFPLTDEMGYMERVQNTLASLYTEWVLFNNKIRQKRILDKYFKNAPTIDELRGNIDLIFSNAHPVFETPRPYLPNIIPIGGIHVQEPKPLPKDIKDFIDESRNGVVFFSLGSHMKISALPKNILDEIFGAFSRLSQNVLMKWEKDEIPNLPHNVMVQKWLPQVSILAHPNVKAFITHGGLMSKIEAIHYAVPMVGIPLFGEQRTNVAHSVMEGIAVQLFLAELSEEALVHALTKVINDKSYSENIKKKSSLLRDQPMKPIDSAIYWAEFVMRHNGTKHLQNKSMRLNRAQNLLLDVLPLIAAITFVIVFIMKKLLAWLMGMLFPKKIRRTKVKKH